MLDENSLDRNAGLPCVTETTGNTAFRGEREVGITVHDYARVAAQLQNNFFLAGIALDRPAHGSAAGETDQLYAIVAHQKTGILVRQRQDIESAIGPARLLYRF